MTPDGFSSGSVPRAIVSRARPGAMTFGWTPSRGLAVGTPVMDLNALPSAWTGPAAKASAGINSAKAATERCNLAANIGTSESWWGPGAVRDAGALLEPHAVGVVVRHPC